MLVYSLGIIHAQIALRTTAMKRSSSFSSLIRFQRTLRPTVRSRIALGKSTGTDRKDGSSVNSTSSSVWLPSLLALRCRETRLPPTGSHQPNTNAPAILPREGACADF
jgi:hypothetical protein